MGQEHKNMKQMKEGTSFDWWLSSLIAGRAAHSGHGRRSVTAPEQLAPKSPRLPAGRGPSSKSGASDVVEGTDPRRDWVRARGSVFRKPPIPVKFAADPLKGPR